MFYGAKKQACRNARLLIYLKLLVLCFGDNQVDDDAQDQSASSGGKGDLTNGHCHAADAGDQDGSDYEQILVLVQVYLLDHLQTGASDEAVQGGADTAHDTAGNGIQEGHEGSEEGDHDAHNSSGGDGNNGGVLGDSHAANGLTVGGVGAAAEESAGHGADAVAQQGVPTVMNALNKVSGIKYLYSMVVCLSVHLLAQMFSLMIRDISTIISYPNSATYLILLIDMYIWEVILYNYYNFKENKENGKT